VNVRLIDGRRPPHRFRRTRHTRHAVLAALVLLVLGAGTGVAASGPGWRTHPPLPDPRSEVAAAAAGGEIVVVGGFLPDGTTSARVDAFKPSTNSWRRLPDLPVAVNHAMAATEGDRVFVVGGYSGAIGAGRIARGAWMLTGGRWWPLPAPPEGRAAGGAAVVAGRLYVVGGVTSAGLATRTLVLHLGRLRWSTVPGPAPREHLAVTAAQGRIYALGGRRAGWDTNVATFQSYVPGGKRWLTLPPVPSTRGGTGAAVASGRVVSIGGEEPNGTIRSVYAYDLAARTWSSLPDLPTPRHGLGVVALGARVYAVGGGTVPGLSVSGTTESIAP
jgi:N-acetylneuraminic acid mutarotase